MPFSHHSHSGQFCHHAADTLEEVVRTAIKKKMQLFALTEHMPRERDDLYPEEIEAAQTQEQLYALFSAYIQEATRLRTLHKADIEILIGMEIDWIRPSSLIWINKLLEANNLDFFIGSIHHVHTIPIDFNREMYVEARVKSGGIDERLYEDYFDLQYEMLQALKPPIVGHFDLIRLMSDDSNADFLQWPGVLQRVSRNLGLIVEYGGILELNSAALRKGMNEPYPVKAVCKLFLAKGGQFALSDDAHNVTQVGTHYRQLLQFAEDIGITAVEYFKTGSSSRDTRFPNIDSRSISLVDLKAHKFFDG